MPVTSYFKQIDEKHVSAVVELMTWSPKMDLIALANKHGEVIVYRLSWQKVWNLPAPAEEVRVTALSWRPDGKVVAIGYCTGRLILCDVENAEVLHETEIKGQITHMSWISHCLSEGETWSNKPYPEDNSDVFLPKLHSLNKSYGALAKDQSEDSAEDSKHLKGQTLLNILVVGSDLDQVHLYGYGVFPLAYIQLEGDSSMKPSRVISAVVSEDLLSLSLITASQTEEDSNTEYFIHSYDLTLVASRHKEIRLVALKYGKVYSLISYMKQTIQQMSEAWEDILMEMDSKLLKFAEDKKASGTGTVSNDFLELLLFGTPSPELQAFLLRDLTEKGLKKLGHSIEASYSNIQKLVVKHLQNVSQAILYELSELRGMSLWYDKFGVLGLNTALLQEAISSAGAFILKTSELQQVIDGSIKNFLAFFRWLYVVIMRLSDEQPPAELSKMTQYDMNFVAEFLKENFAQFSEDEYDKDPDDTENDSIMEEVNKEQKPGFKLEKVGQYLKNENLPYPPDRSGNPWDQFVKASTNLKDSPLLYRVEAEKSLVQLQESLEGSISSALSHPSTVIGKFVFGSNKSPLFSVPNSHSEKDKDRFTPKVSQFTVIDQHNLYTVFTTEEKPCQHFYILRRSTKQGEKLGDIVCLSVGLLSQSDTGTDNSMEERSACPRHKIVDLSFYDQKSLSLLLVEDNEENLPVLAQFPLAALEDHMFTPINQPDACITNIPNLQSMDIGYMIEAANWKILENMKADSFAVSGTRKVACVLFSSRRRVRLFLMDMEEEEEDETEESQLEPESSNHGNSYQEESMMSNDKAGSDENKENANIGDIPTT